MSSVRYGEASVEISGQERFARSRNKFLEVPLSRFVFLLLCFFSMIPCHSNADWPNFRGAGPLSGFTTETLGTNPVLLWDAATSGSIKSSPIIAENKVFIGSDDEHLHTFDLQTGKRLWAFDCKSPIEAPPTFFQGQIFAGSVDGIMFALDAQTGAEKWRYDTKEKIVGSANIMIDPQSGNALLLFGCYDNYLYCLEVQTGKLIWKYQTESYVNGMPVRWRNDVVVGGCDASLHIVSLTTGQSTKSIKVGSYIASTLAIVDDATYVGHYGNRFVKINLETGDLDWAYGKREFPFFSSAALTDKLALIGGRDRRLHAVDRQTGKKIWEFQARGKIDSSPVVAAIK